MPRAKICIMMLSGRIVSKSGLDVTDVIAEGLVIMNGKPVAEAVEEGIRSDVEALMLDGIVPKLAIVRMGARPDDIAYERGIKRKCAALGVATEVHTLPMAATEYQLFDLLQQLGRDDSVHSILPFRPFPPQISLHSMKYVIDPSKDVDCIGPSGSASIYDRSLDGFLPCTAEAVMEMLRHYKVVLEGARAVIVGRSMVVGRALALLMLDANATVTVCHSKTPDLAKIASEADILVSAIGRPRMIGQSHIKKGAVVIDVGINDDGCDGICGDVDESAAASVAGALTPVPGGIGVVTTTLLVRNVVNACKNASTK